MAAGGIISMFRALPLIFGSIVAGLRDLRASRAAAAAATATVRTERDMPMTVVLFGSLALVVVLAAVPQLGLGLTFQGLLGAVMILLFGFLFVTVSSPADGRGRLVVQPDLRHDHRHAAVDLPDLLDPGRDRPRRRC